jgi:hypothetical protein
MSQVKVGDKVGFEADRERPDHGDQDREEQWPTICMLDALASADQAEASGRRLISRDDAEDDAIHQTRIDVIGATENRPIHPCEARQSGQTTATARQITNSPTSAARAPSQSDIEGLLPRSACSRILPYFEL